MLVAAEDNQLPSARSFWADYHAELLNEPPSDERPPIGDPYTRFRLPSVQVNAPQSGWFGGDNPGFCRTTWAFGDFDIAAHIQILDFLGAGPPSGGAYRLFGIGVHDPLREPDRPAATGYGWQFYYRMIGQAPGAWVSLPDITNLAHEWKYRLPNDPTVTFDSVELEDALGATAWVRLRRSGQTMSSWSADGSGPMPMVEADWSNQHSVAMPDLPELVMVGPQIYSVPLNGNPPQADPTAAIIPNVQGRLFRFFNWV